MKRVVKYKNLICLTTVLILLLSLTVSSYAIWNPFDYQRNRAFVAAALTALNIAFQSQQMAAQSVVEYIADPLEVNYTYIDAWQDRPQIQIWDDYITIDGQQYTDIWISNEAAEKFRVNAFDFNTAYQIASNDSGTFASGVGEIDGLPVFDTGTSLTTQHIKYPSNPDGVYSMGNGTSTVSHSQSNTYTVQYNTSNGQTATVTKAYRPPTESWYTVVTQGGIQYPYTNTKWGNYGTSYEFFTPNTPFVTRPFDFDWISQTIPADQPLPSDTGMMIRVPSSDPLGNRYFDDFLLDNPEFNQGEPVTIDVDLDPDIMNKLSDLIDIVIPIIPMINNNHGEVTFIENHEAPIPPIPDTPIVDATVPQVVNPIINEITNYGDQITQQIPNIIETIPTIDDICNNIDTAPYHDLDTGLDKLPTVFLPFITDLRSALGIWHYVTEWLGMIGTSFAFVTGCLTGTAIMTPIYAAIAGYMCIKVYRRMTG